jgi:hypothetical protein
MIHSVQHCISRMTRYVTLHPGDVIEIEDTGIGVLRSPVTRAATP